MSNPYRKKKLINLQLQLKLIGTFTAISCFAALAQVVLLSQSMISLSEELGDASAEFRKRLPEVLASDVGWTLGFLIPFMLLVGVHITHKVAGPVYRIDCYLGEVAEKGEVTIPCRVRDEDEMQLLVRSVNAAFERLVADRLAEQGETDTSEPPVELDEERKAA